MDKLSKVLAVAYSALIILLFAGISNPVKKSKRSDKVLAPYQFDDYKRTFPDVYPDNKAYQKAMQQVAANLGEKAGNPFGGAWQVEGPGNIGGRLNCIAVHPQNSNIIYTGTPTWGPKLGICF